MRGVNRVTLIGTLGKDPETRFFPSGDAVANVSMATSETWKDKQTGEQKEATEWHNLVFPGKLAEIVGKFAKKGSKLYVEGSIRTRKWQDKEGKDRFTTEIRVSDMQLLDSKPAGGSEQRGGERRSANTGATRQTTAAHPVDPNDDIPW